MTRNYIDDKVFAAAWTKASSAKEVAEELGTKTVTCTAKAAYLRSHGVPLKPMPRHGRTAKDYAELSAYVASLSPDVNGEVAVEAEAPTPSPRRNRKRK